MSRSLLFSVPLLLTGTALAAPAAAQTYAAPTRTDADRLADAVRRVGASPRDLSALVEAGELSIKVGDATAAAAFFKRAEQVDPNNGRVKAGIARILVAGEHPGEALRYFDQAARTGLSMAPYAGDRGLAYDLTGEQERAQRDYRLALKQGDDDEIRRRYALSLGIAGRKDDALKEIDALLRRSDRGAWRARAFILAMNGDVPGANKIATSMMPGMASGLSAFFQRLPALAPVDRAFAVHFGEVAPTPARLADARLAPPLSALGADPDAPRATQVATVASAPAPAQVARNERRDPPRTTTRESRRDRERGRVLGGPVVTGRPLPGGGVAPVATPPVSASVAAVAATSPAVAPTATSVAAPVATTTPAPAVTRPTTSVAAASPVYPAPTSSTPRPAAANVPTGVPATPPATAPASSTPAAPATVASRPVAPMVASATPIPGVVPAVTTRPATPAPIVAATRSAPQPAIAAARPVTQPANAAPAPPRGDADEILARIVAGIRIPESELARAPARPAAPGSAAPGSAATLDRAARQAERNVAAQRGTQRSPVRAAEAEDTPARPTAAERRAKAAADRKAKQEAAEKKALADKAAAEKKAAKADPVRYWVQVAGGANQGDLGRAWADAKKKAPALAGKTAYTTPLRATNRVVTGPFKSEAEARAMVNTLSKQGLSAFSFTSAAGQKMTRLGEK